MNDAPNPPTASADLQAFCDELNVLLNAWARSGRISTTEFIETLLDAEAQMLAMCTRSNMIEDAYRQADKRLREKTAHHLGRMAHLRAAVENPAPTGKPN